MIVLHGQASAGFRAQLAGAFVEPVTVVDDLDAGTLAEVTALLHILTPLDAATIGAAPKLKLIQKIGVGVNTIDLKAAKANGIAVCNMPGTNSQAVAEQALALMMAVLRRTVTLDARMKAGQGWGDNAAVLDRTGEVAGRTVGLVGLGDSASRLAPVLAALGARVVYTARSAKQVPYEYLSLDRLLAESDIVSLHIPLTDETRGSIDARAMKPGAILVNSARGELVDESALLEALSTGHLRGAGLDVLADEPVTAHPIFDLDNVVLAPHVAWLTPETLARSLTVAAENCRRVAAGEPLLHRVA